MSQGAQIIELDTDGIYFSPPDGITIEGLQSELAAQLPAGIGVEFDSQYQAMFTELKWFLSHVETCYIWFATAARDNGF
jgi:DNA polymerase elongation subunit (family B)